MFKLDSNPVFTRSVQVTTPDGAGCRSEDFSATFRALTVAEHNKHDLQTPEGTQSFLEAVFVSATDITEVDGKPVAWSAVLKSALLDLNHVRAGLIRAYFEGIATAKPGN